MKCNEIQQYLYLYRDDELHDEPRKLLRDHLDSCPTCLAESDNISEIAELINLFRASVLTPENPDHLHSRIMHSIPKKRGRPVRTSIFDRLLSRLTVRKIRIAFAGTVVFFIAIFLAEQTLLIKKLTALEDRMSTQREPSQLQAPDWYRALQAMEPANVSLTELSLEDLLGLLPKQLRNDVPNQLPAEINNRSLASIVSRGISPAERRLLERAGIETELLRRRFSTDQLRRFAEQEDISWLD
ncbi:MAG: zf-HC2 domain-containing protein [Candidatus Marinimicrobia bacterium]|nr:zf-HC2 domain-containing protein [Candidatus Neomarinimicrobiota bacterium]MCF7828608.1 zf-HC2 domain-containing protein [Candidatus Neomarinimicrobiota bacterium]MCF7880349.1 zf-HC2 domain-containing protein [Candidatus Neomarinimicrobiota bacterium]